MRFNRNQWLASPAVTLSTYTASIWLKLGRIRNPSVSGGVTQIIIGTAGTGGHGVGFSNNKLSLSTTTTSNNESNNSDKVSFKESINGIEKFWNDLNSDLDQKKKDLEELTKMYSKYKYDDLITCMEFLREQIDTTNQKMLHIQRIMWDVRTTILFNTN